MGWRRVLYLLSLAGCIAFYLIYRMWLSGLVLVFILALPWFSLLVSLPGLIAAKLRLDIPLHGQLDQTIPANMLLDSPLPPPHFRGWLKVKNNMTGEVWDLKPGEELPRTTADSWRSLPVPAGCMTIWACSGFPYERNPAALCWGAPWLFPWTGCRI